MEQFEQSQSGESSLDIKEYLHMLWSWAWLIALVGLLSGAAAYAISKHTAPVYQASTRLLVSAPSTLGGIDPSSLVTSQTMTSTYAEMLLDRPVLQGVIDQLKLSTPSDNLKKAIIVDVVPNTQLLRVTVKDGNPARAADVANVIASVFTARMSELQSQRYSASREGLAAQVRDMEQQITRTSAEIAALEQRRAAVVTQTAEAGENGTLAAPPATAAPDPALVQLQAQLSQYRTIYSNLVTSYEQVRLAEEQTSTNVVVSEPAVVPSVPVSPKTGLNTVLAMVAGMLLTAAAILVTDAFDDTIQNPDEIRRRFSLPILGMIAVHGAPKDETVTLANPRSPAAEAFRSLRTKIKYAAVDRPLRRILITSPTPQDGKTTVACNLAVVLSQNEERVVLLDADLRRPQVHHKFGLQNRVGLSELFVRPLGDLSSVLNPINPPKLAVLTAGGLPPNPAELLASHAMSNILDTLNQHFDIIVIDTPPLLTVTDAAALVPTVDGVILVVKPGTTKLGALRQALEELRAVGARVLGIVLNEVNPSSRRQGYYYSRYYSAYSPNFDRRRLGLRSLVRSWGKSIGHRGLVSAMPDAAGAFPDSELLRAGEPSKEHGGAVSEQAETAASLPGAEIEK